MRSNNMDSTPLTTKNAEVESTTRYLRFCEEQMQQFEIKSKAEYAYRKKRKPGIPLQRIGIVRGSK
jgi:hypothetical protein